MQISDGFTVQAPIDEVYATLLDLERVAPCVPGAKLVEQGEDGAQVVAIRIKVGPMAMQYKANVDIVERDPAAHRAVMRVRAKETRGGGTADATARLQLSQEGADTVGAVEVDVALSGKVASMGQGAIQDVSSRIVAQFAGNLAEMLTGAPDGAAPADAETAAPAPPPAAEQESALSAGDLAMAVVAGRLREPKVALGAAFVALLIGFLLGRRSRAS